MLKQMKWEGRFLSENMPTRRRDNVLTFAQEVLGTLDGGEIVGHHFTKDVDLFDEKQLYLAYKTSDGETMGVIVSYHIFSFRKQYYISACFSPEGRYKLFYGMPDKLLKLLTTTTDPDVADWRAKCAENNAALADSKAYIKKIYAEFRADKAR